MANDGGHMKSINNEDYVEITLDVVDDTLAIHSADVDDPEVTLLAKESYLGRIRQCRKNLQV